VEPVSSVVGGVSAGGEDPLISSEVEPVSSVVGGCSGMEPAISGAEVNSEMEAEVADSLSVSKEGNGAPTCRDRQGDVPLISDGTTNSHLYCLNSDGGDGGARRIDQSDLSSIDEDVKNMSDRAATEPGAISHSQISEDIPGPSLPNERVDACTTHVHTPIKPSEVDQNGTHGVSPRDTCNLLPKKGDTPLISPPALDREDTDGSENYPSGVVTIVERVQGDVPVIKEILLLAPEREDADCETTKNYSPSPSLLPTEGGAPLISFSDEIECSHIHPCPLLPENLPSPLVTEWDAPLNSTVNESFDNLPCPLLSTAGEISLTFITNESFVNHQSPLPPKEGDAPSISTTDESSGNIPLVEGDIPQNSTTNASSLNCFKEDAPSISSIRGSSEDLLQLKGDIAANSSTQGGALAPPISIEGESLANSSPFLGDAPSISSIEVNFDETSLPVFQLDDSESDDDQETTTEACTETTSLGSVSEEDRGQRSSSPHGNGCYSTIDSAPLTPNEQVSTSIQLVQSLTTGALNAASPCSVETEGGLLRSSVCCNSCQLSDLSHDQREKHKEEDNRKNNNNINSIPPQLSVNIAAQETPTELGQEFDKNMYGICSPHSSLSPSPSPPPCTPSHPPHPSLQPSPAQVASKDTAQVAVASEDNCPPLSSSSANQGEFPALVCV
jgi:hypothetical protein